MECLYPRTTQTSDGFLTTFRCRSCKACRTTRRASWIARLCLELSEQEYGRFVTLTYDQMNVTRELEYRGIQLFLKRLRKNTRLKTRFYCCGEYGSKLSRPHWHLIIFTKGMPVSEGDITKAWQKGFVKVSEQQLSLREMYYCTKYMMKNENSLVRMSRRPGLGLTTLYKFGKLAKQHGIDVGQPPPYINLASRKYPLDGSMKDSFMQGFIDAGGIPLPPSSPIVRDLRIRLDMQNEPHVWSEHGTS
jgi:hypothetical protein